MHIQNRYVTQEESLHSHNAKAIVNTRLHEQHIVSRKVIANDLLASLQRTTLDTALHYPELVRFAEMKTLFDCGDTVPYVYFPTTAIVSLLYVMSNGATTEMAVIGHEGMIGMWWGMGERALCRAVVQSGGYAYRIRVQDIRDAVSQGGELPQLLMSYTNTQFALLAHKAVGGRRSSITQILAQWLLERLGRSPTNELKITHELIASMLGVRRETISEAMGKLQSLGAIKCQRGKIIFLDRSELERNAGQRHCYEAMNMTYGRASLQM